MKKNTALFCLLFISQIVPTAAWSQTEIPAPLQAAIFFKIIAYDKNMPTRAGETVTVGIVTDTDSAGQKNELLDAFEKLQGRKIQGKELRITSIHVSKSAQLSSKAKAANADILYATKGAAHDTIQEMLMLAETQKYTIWSNSEELAEQGFAVGLANKGGLPKIIVNLNASRRQGLALSSKVLRLAKVIK